MTDPVVENKIKYILLEISKQKGGEDSIVEIINHSEFNFEPHWNNQAFPNAYNLEVKLTPDVFTKYYTMIKNLSEIILSRINESTKLFIANIRILPDYNKLSLINSKVQAVRTEWDEINQLQQKLIENLQRAVNSTDFQNIGNTARTIMDKVARLVFDPKKHKPKDLTKLVNNGKFKNQLHSFIDAVLSGTKNKDYRKLANSSIDFVENACDLMNTTTHKLDTEKQLAEVCVISTVSAISIINLIRHLE